MKNAKKLILLLLCALMPLCSCQSGSGTPGAPVPATVSDDASESVPGEELLILSENGEPRLGIFFPDNYRPSASSAARTLASSLSSLAGAEIKAEAEHFFKPEEALIRVNVGRTQTELSQKLFSMLAPDEIGFIVEDGEIAVGAVGDDFTAQACGLFLSTVMSSGPRGSVTVPASAQKIAKCSSPLPDNLPNLTGAAGVEYNDCSDGFFALTCSEVSEERYADYLSELKDAGFEMLYDNAVGANLYAAFSDGENEVHAYRLAESELVRVCVGPAGDPMPREEHTGEEKATLSFPALKKFGLSMVFQLSDGRFVIVDGGQQSETRGLVGFLKDHTPSGEKPVVAAWFFTHAHPDHTYAFYGLRETSLASAIRVENFVFNFPCRKVYEQCEPDCIAQTGNVLGVISDSFPSAHVIKPHTGDQMKIGGLTVDFLCTQEDLLVNRISEFNDSSMVMRFTVAGTTVMVTGDMSESCFSFMNLNYEPEDLKCDILQVPHHGWNLNSRFFISVDPEIIFIPNNSDQELKLLFTSQTLKPVTQDAVGLYGCALSTLTLSLPYGEASLPTGYSAD